MSNTELINCVGDLKHRTDDVHSDLFPRTDHSRYGLFLVICVRGNQQDRMA